MEVKLKKIRLSNPLLSHFETDFESIPFDKIKPKDFVGYSSITLQHENIRPVSEESNVPSLLTNYTVTDKADGLRKLLYIYNVSII